MDTSRWDRIQDVYLEVSELEPLAREARLAELRATDPELAEEVRSLLESDGGDTLLDASVDELALLLGDDDADDDDLPDAPDHIGPWRIEGLLGRGGMGMVYRAVRDDGRWDRTVALKLIRGGATDPDARARFRREQRILASLEHPGIARLYDAGVSDDGLPWLAMELVEGEPIHRWCDARGLGIAERLRIFEKVCEAVEFAHRSLVIHRDLKPSNILVTEEGRVKLLDFGIARLVEADDAVDEPLTRAGQRVLTPGYSSPEQLRGERLTTASDVYTLGVVLHRLLTGVTPEPPTVADTEVTRPSAVVGSAAEDWPGWAPTDQVKRDLRGDLDTLLMKALRTDPAERYASVADLREDLVRWREQRPLSARPLTMGYRTSRFVRRNRGAVGAGTVLAIVLIVAAGLLVRAERRAEAEAARAEVEAETATEVSDFLVNILRGAAPDVAQGQEITVLEVLDEAQARVRSDLDESPEVRDRLLAELAGIYNQLGQAETALEIGDYGLANAGEDPDPEVVHALEIGRAQALKGLGQYDDAREALTSYLERLQSDDVDVARRRSWALTELGELLTLIGDLDQADSVLVRAVRLDSALMVGDTSRNLGNSLNNLGLLREMQRRVGEGAEALEEALQVRLRTLGDRHPEVAQSYTNLSTIWGNAAEFERALPWVERSLELNASLYDRAHPIVLNDIQAKAFVLNGLGRDAEALPLAEESLELRLQSLPENHPDLALSYNTLAQIHLALEDLDRALENFEAARAIFDSNLGADHVYTQTLTVRVGRLHVMVGDTARGVDLVEQGLAWIFETWGPEVPEAEGLRAELLTVFEKSGRQDQVTRILETYPVPADTATGGVELR